MAVLITRESEKARTSVKERLGKRGLGLVKKYAPATDSSSKVLCPLLFLCLSCQSLLDTSATAVGWIEYMRLAVRAALTKA